MQTRERMTLMSLFSALKNPRSPEGKTVVPFHRTSLGTIYNADALNVFERNLKPKSVNLIMTSPPFGLVRKKDYGNVDSHEYLDWFRPFAEAFKPAHAY
jgi:hypothetical protein